MLNEAEDMFLRMDSVEDRFLLVRVSMVWVELRPNLVQGGIVFGDRGLV